MNKNLRVGRVLRASSRGFVVGCQVMQADIPTFGSFVRTEEQMLDRAVYGLIYDVSVEDDPFVRQFISADPPDEVVRDQRDNRQALIEVSVLAVGCGGEDGLRHCLPAQPPVTLDWLYQCSDDEIRLFTTRFDYFRLVLNAREAPVDELLTASLWAAAEVRSEGERETFLIEAGRELARLLAGDLAHLDGLLRRLRQNADRGPA